MISMELVIVIIIHVARMNMIFKYPSPSATQIVSKGLKSFKVLIMSDESKSFETEAMIRGYHEYHNIWTAKSW